MASNASAPSPATTNGTGFSYFGCKVCGMRGMPYSSNTLNEHLKTISHRFMKQLHENGLWPGPHDQYECPIKRLQIYKFLDSRGTVVCEACNKVMPDAISLLNHQQDEDHHKMLQEKKLDAVIPTVYSCDLCDVLVCGSGDYYDHCFKDETHIKELEKKNLKELEKEEMRKKAEEKSAPKTSSTNFNDLVLSDVSASDASDTSSNFDEVSNVAEAERQMSGDVVPKNNEKPQKDLRSMLDHLNNTSSSALSNSSTNTLSIEDQSTTSKVKANMSSFDQQRMQNLLASICQTPPPPQDQQTLAKQHQQQTSINGGSLLDVLLKKNNSAASQVVEDTNGSTADLINRILATVQQQPSPAEIERRKKVEALNNLDFLLDKYIGEVGQRLQMEQAKLNEMVQLKNLASLSRESPSEFEMSYENIVKLTDVVRNKLNMSPNPLSTILAPQVPNFVDNLNFPIPNLVDSLKFLPPSLNEVLMSLTAKPLMANNSGMTAGMLNNLIGATGIGLGMGQQQMDNGVKPRYVNTDELAASNVLEKYSGVGRVEKYSSGTEKVEKYLSGKHSSEKYGRSESRTSTREEEERRRRPVYSSSSSHYKHRRSHSRSRSRSRSRDRHHYHSRR